MKPLAIMGINTAHDASASLVIDGQFKVAITEDRLTRFKCKRGYPSKAVDYCLEATGIRQLRAIDCVVLNQPPTPGLASSSPARWTASSASAAKISSSNTRPPDNSMATTWKYSGPTSGSASTPTTIEQTMGIPITGILCIYNVLVKATGTDFAQMRSPAVPPNLAW
ncbi:MAG: hypothetical protein J0H49_13510 [Acidobacteria bacterium]|nr:hypothetical protein [Acidobacteriota bacterium]